MGLKPKTWSRRTRRAVGAGTVVAAALAIAAATTPAFAGVNGHGNDKPKPVVHTSTPIKHVVVIFQENVSFDHYFGTYPKAANTDGTPFKAKSGTPQVNGLDKKLLTNNPNEYNPTRLTPDQALTCDQNHGYGAEQKAYDGGKADAFVQNTETDKCTGQPILFGQPGLVMDYYDGNTVTGLWNYAQNYAMSDNSFSTGFGPSTPGALNLISGNTHGVIAVDSKTGEKVSNSLATSPDAKGVGTVIGDPDPAFDDCSDNNHTSTNALAKMTGQNVGDLLNNEGVTWGWFQGGFRPTGSANGYAVCGATHTNIGGNAVTDYSPHHNPFEYYKSTSNPKHLPPSSVAKIGQTDQANHNYDLTDFDAALSAGNLPAVSFLKAGAYQDGHPGNSDPLDEQQFVVNEINKLQKSKDWDSTAVVIAYDDSDGWYDHVTPPIVNGSTDSANDQAALCAPTKKTKPLNGYLDRCGYGPRQPLLVVSPYSKTNFVDHSVTNQASILRFIEDNWKTGRVGDGSFDASSGTLNNLFNFHQKPNTKPVLLDPKTGAVTK
ncbi:phospholipase C [Rugosimonospora africana]|uniref:Phospholipase C n=1 Tax=Rugosimonospora africana TaxID=556532 RepID=A0A8J3VUA1_9ACTN|nr:alkaline phosphatase family protein [Rugosimonospora africana]GIH19287.1 phospholipase C [Rugosimonospora africana]